MAPSDEKKPEAVLVAEYFYNLDSWLDTYFGGLKDPGDWELLFVHLVRIVVELANDDQTDAEQIDQDQIIMPKLRNIFQACRLMYQAIGGLRTAVPDGQHRVAAMIELLSGWKITVEPRNIPPKVFAEGDHSGLAKGNRDIMKKKNTTKDFNEILNTLAGKVTIRILRPETADLEKKGEEYSLVREQSQSKHKPRGFVDV